MNYLAMFLIAVNVYLIITFLQMLHVIRAVEQLQREYPWLTAMLPTEK